MKKAINKTVELSNEELIGIEGGSLTEVAYEIWKSISYCFNSNTRTMYENDRYMENFYNH